MPTAEATGSQKLVASLIAKGTSATPGDIKEALAIPVSADYKLLHWFPRGIPPVYQEAEAVLEVTQEKLPEAISLLAKNASINSLNILIRGIPPIYKAQITAILGE